AQLVDDETILVNTMTRDGVPPVPMDAAGVREKFGVNPDQIIDFLSLTGDTVDNVPGVDKVGPKTAAKWLNEYGTLDALMAQAGAIKGKVGENLRAALDWLPKGRELVTVLRDADLSAWVGGIDQLQLRDEDEETLLRLFDRWELRTFARRLVAERQRREGGAAGGLAGGVDGLAAGTAGGIDGLHAQGLAASGSRVFAEGGSTAGSGAAAGVSGTAGAAGTVAGGGPGAGGIPAGSGASAAGAGAASGPRGAGVAAALAEFTGGHFTRDGIVLDAPPAGELRTVMITTRAALEDWLAKVQAADRVAIDTETTALDAQQAHLVGISLAVSPWEGAYIPVGHSYAGAPDQLPLDEVLAVLKPWLEDDRPQKVGQNIKYDMHVLANHGVRLRGVADDTMLESYVLEAHRTHGMDALAGRHLNRLTTAYESVAGKGAKAIGFDQVALEVAAPYAAEDADVTLQLHRVMAPAIAANETLQYVYRDIEMPTLQVLFDMERHGVLLDGALLKQQSVELATQMLALEKQAHELAGQPFNLGSTKQLGEILFGQLGLPVVKKTPAGKPSTD
ncbi:MAG: DNA polymerase I, partial [Lautropia sp.]